MVTRLILMMAGLFLLVGAPLAEASRQAPLKDLYFGEALYYAHQEEYFDAIVRLDTELGQHYSLDEPELGSLSYHLGQAEFYVGDIELSYRMHKRAGHAIKTVIDGDVDEATRNFATYRLAKIYFQKNQYLSAQHAIEELQGDIAENHRADTQFLRGQIYMANGRFEDAIETLAEIRKEKSVQGFASYNLGIALIAAGSEKEGLLQLDRVGSIDSNEKSILAIKDKANLALAYYLLERDFPEKAKPYFERIRLSGPFSNRALLGAGWVEVALDRFDRALVPWTLLHQRDRTNEAVQEALMGVPYAYAQLGIHGKATVFYGQAMDVFDTELNKLDASIKSIRQGTFLKALMLGESLNDTNWLLSLRELEDSPETLYLMDLMASHDFQESLKNYRDLTILDSRLNNWTDDLDAYKEIVQVRRQYYEPLLPELALTFNSLDSRMRLRMAQSVRLDDRIQSMTVTRRPDFLATTDERTYLNRISAIEQKLQTSPHDKTGNMDDRLRRVKGVISFQIATDYDERHTQAYKSLGQLDDVVKQLQATYSAYVRNRQSATQSYVGYEQLLELLTLRIEKAKLKLDSVLAKQGHVIELLAINELESRQKRLEAYQIKARFAMAESFDRAQQSQNDKKTRALEVELKNRREELDQQATQQAQLKASAAPGQPTASKQAEKSQ